MFENFRLRLHKTIFVNYNRYLRELIDSHAAGRCPDAEFQRTGDRYFEILGRHYQKAFDLSRKAAGVPDENLQRAWENLCQHYERNRFRKVERSLDVADKPKGSSGQPDEAEIEVANEYYQWPQEKIQAFIEHALQECRGPNGETNRQALFIKLLDGYLRDEFLTLGRKLNGKAPRPTDLLDAQMRALNRCYQANSFCFDEGEFGHFRQMVELNLSPEKFYEENVGAYSEVVETLRMR